MDTLGRIKDILGADWAACDSYIGSYLSSDISLLNSTNESILKHGGKRLRPILALLFSRLCGGSTDDSHRFAAASEMLHNATLLHDDVADESKERRGCPTVASLLGPSSAVLLGDFWLARAMELILSSQRKDKVMHLFSKTLTDLAEGEMLQLQKAGTADTSEDDYFRIIYCKTASLFEATCVAGAISADASPQMVSAAGEYARAQGIAFQIKDDILDYSGTEEIGKPRGVDILERKITLPLLGALKGNPREKEIRDMVRNIDGSDSNCDVIRRFVMEEGGVEYASSVLEGYVRKAEASLSVFPDCETRDMLVELARFNSFRTL